ncbi:phosphotransferase [Marinobacteraceae bacterium S3BR75-40.1]
MDPRAQQLERWLTRQLQTTPEQITPVAGDASFRRYFRVQYDGDTFIAMDAPPEKEDCHPFLAIARRWHQAGIHVPQILHADIAQGFLLLEDMGDDLYLPQLEESRDPGALYRPALETLARIQGIPAPVDYALPPYDDALLDREMNLFRDWLVKGALELALSSTEEALIDTTFAFLREAALAQPVVTVHRDYHSRNLLVTTENTPGVLDFQDAVSGPVTYDLVSLLKDCYISWPKAQRQAWMEEFRLLSRDAGHHHADADTFTQWFELMGMQRHLKAAGIFARLSRRDGKHGYLNDIPRTLNYLTAACEEQPALRSFRDWLEDRVLPQLHRLEAA